MAVRQSIAESLSKDVGATCIVLAAGRASRFGSDKTLAQVDGETLLQRVLRSCASYDTVVVCSPANAYAVQAHRTVVNRDPQRGMTHSLRVADAVVPPERDIVVLLADMPLVRTRAIDEVVAALRDADVAFPHDGARVGHPVGFGPAARRLLRELPEGDTLRLVRDDPRLQVARLSSRDWTLFSDVDVPQDLQRFNARR